MGNGIFRIEATKNGGKSSRTADRDEAEKFHRERRLTDNKAGFIPVHAEKGVV
jgi:hypothetical protein